MSYVHRGAREAEAMMALSYLLLVTLDVRKR